MPCPASPEPDGFHKYQLAPQSDQAPATYETCCVYCGQEKQLRPQPAPNLWQAGRIRGGVARGTAAMLAAKRRKREAGA